LCIKRAFQSCVGLPENLRYKMPGTFRKLIFHSRRAAFIKMFSFLQLLCIRVHIFQGFAYNPVLCIRRAFQSCVGFPVNLRYKMQGTFHNLTFSARSAAKYVQKVKIPSVSEHQGVNLSGFCIQPCIVHKEGFTKICVLP
jgi:hypothetical protein